MNSRSGDADVSGNTKSSIAKGDFKQGCLKVNILATTENDDPGVSTPTPLVSEDGFLTKGTDGSDVMMGELVLLQESKSFMSPFLDKASK